MIPISLSLLPRGSMTLSRKAGLVLVCLILANTCGWSQNPIDEPPAKAEPVHSSITVIGNIETEAPAFVSTMNQQRIEEQPGINLDDRLRSIPGFTLFRRSSSV